VVDDHGKKWTRVALANELLENVDCAVFTTVHSCFDVERVVERAKLVVDLKNVVKGVNIENGLNKKGKFL
jgi:UDP-N-acetyl-D-mannosaminuronate dehydrogenase